MYKTEFFRYVFASNGMSGIIKWIRRYLYSSNDKGEKKHP